MKTSILTGLAIAALAAATPAQAGELFGGLFVHNVDTPLSLGGSPEGGIDLQLGYRGGPIIKGTGIEPYVFASANTQGDTHFAAAGLSWKFGDRIYIRPGIGLAVHTGSSRNRDNPFNDKIEFGSRILFEPELGIGARLNDRMSIEASWVHLSHATLFGRQNPGIDNIGARLNYKF
ncbi:MAG: acyloxyacyl hydrolase [Sphingomicrobium sp.]